MKFRLFFVGSPNEDEGDRRQDKNPRQAGDFDKRVYRMSEAG